MYIHVHICLYIYIYVCMQVMNMATALRELYLADQQLFANASSWMVACTCGSVYIFMCVCVCVCVCICIYASHEYGDSITGTLFGRSAGICKCRFVDDCEYMWTCTYIHVRMSVCTYTYVCICKLQTWQEQCAVFVLYIHRYLEMQVRG